MRLVNAALTGAFDMLFLPWRATGPLWALVVVSALAGVAMLWLFGRSSNQGAIRAVRDRIRGNIIAIRLFGDDVGLLFRLQGRILRLTAGYLRHAFVPLLVLVVPVVLVLIQFDLRFTARPLRPGEPVLVKALLRDPAHARRGVELVAPEGVRVETPGVRVPALGEVAWRVRAEREGRFALRVTAAGETVEKELRVGGAWGATSTKRTGDGVIDTLLHPGEPPIASSSPLRAVEVRYPALPLRAFGFGVDWVVAFLVVSLVAGFACKRWLGVEV